MKKIKKTFSTLQSIQSIEIPVSEFLDFKIIDAKLELITESNNANVVIKYEGYDANDNPVSWIVDELPSFSTKTKLSFNISDELQESINNAQPLKLNFFDKETNLPTQINTNGQIALDAEFVTISEFNKNSENFSVNLGKSGSLDTNLTTGCFSLTTPLTSIDNKTLPVLLNLNYNSFDVKKELKNGLPKNFSLNYGQLLFKGDDTSNLTFEYIDNNGEKQLIEEKYYVGDEKIDRSELMIDLDGNYITKDGKRVSTKLESKGVNLVSSIEGINGYKSVSYQPEELENVLNQIKNLEMNKSQLNSAISENKENLCLYAITKKIMRDQIDTQEQSLTESKNELSLQENIEKLKSIYYTESRDYSGSDLAKKYLKGHFFTKYHIENLLKTLNGRNSENKELNAFDKIAVGDENNKQYLKWDDVFCVLKLLNIESSSIYSLGYDLNNTDGSIKSQQKNIEKSLSYYNQQIDSSFIDNSAVESNIEIDGETKNKIVNENLVYNVSEKDLLNIDLQIKNLTAKNNEYILQIE